MENETYYVLKVNGVAVSQPTTRELAEQQKNQLPMESKRLAEVVAVTCDGKEILFG